MSCLECDYCRIQHWGPQRRYTCTKTGVFAHNWYPDEDPIWVLSEDCPLEERDDEFER